MSAKGRGCVKSRKFRQNDAAHPSTFTRILAQLDQRPRNFNDIGHYRIAHRVFTQPRPNDTRWYELLTVLCVLDGKKYPISLN